MAIALFSLPNSDKNIPVITPIGTLINVAIPTIKAVPRMALAKPLGWSSTPTGAGRDTSTSQLKCVSPSPNILYRIANKGSTARAVRKQAISVIPRLNKVLLSDRGL
ncbi:hypothetical protein [Microcoleus vaginatus]|uniref:hypothetical protein n=1 Tax=Microcoleus vaginatus TaxID=119532 RepID=UPI00403F3DDE